VHRANLTRILRYVRANGPRSRNAITLATGLPKTTVSGLVDELVERRLVREPDAEYAVRMGNAGRGVALNPDLGAVGRRPDPGSAGAHRRGVAAAGRR
jgi:DNA-binding IclR family transcriptional regulator